MATYRNRRGGVVVSSLSDAEAYRLLATSNDTFHLSLAKGYRKFGRFTAEQLYWAHKGALDIQRTQLPAPVPVHRPAVQNAPASVRLPPAGRTESASPADSLESMLQGHPPEVLRFMARLAQTAGISLPIPEQDQPQEEWNETAVVPVQVQTEQPVQATVELGHNAFTLFQNAKSKLKFPKIFFDLDMPEGDKKRQIVLSIAGPKSKRPGVINVTSEGGYANNTYYGYVGKDGVFVPYQACDQVVIDFLTVFAADPVGVAKSYGKRTGRCCFCGDVLTTEKRENGVALYSVDLGYGPQCAKNWGLPYGLAAADPAAVAAKKGKGKSKTSATK